LPYAEKDQTSGKSERSGGKRGGMLATETVRSRGRTEKKQKDKGDGTRVKPQKGEGAKNAQGK